MLVNGSSRLCLFKNLGGVDGDLGNALPWQRHGEGHVLGTFLLVHLRVTTLGRLEASLVALL